MVNPLANLILVGWFIMILPVMLYLRMTWSWTLGKYRRAKRYANKDIDPRAYRHVNFFFFDHIRCDQRMRDFHKWGLSEIDDIARMRGFNALFWWITIPLFYGSLLNILLNRVF